MPVSMTQVNIVKGWNMLLHNIDDMGETLSEDNP
jgi:hypothetical protein